ncbi:MAG: gluconate 2-dehydrogenase subunit 3 family protein [Xanthobacteraceae bacterium]
MHKNVRISFMLRRLRRPIKAVQHHALLSRRLVLAALVRLPLIGAVAMPGQRVLAARRPPQDESHVRLTIDSIVGHMLPGGELPSAQDLNIPQRITDTGDRELKRSFAEGIAWLDGRAQMAGALNFRALDEAGKEAILQAALASADGAGAFVSELRTLAFTHYFTHPTVMAAFAYSGPPQPAGFPDFQEATR